MRILENLCIIFPIFSSLFTIFKSSFVFHFGFTNFESEMYLFSPTCKTFYFWKTTMEHPLGKKRITEKGRPKAHALHRTNVNNFAAYYVKYSLKLGNLKFGKNEGRMTESQLNCFFNQIECSQNSYIKLIIQT